MAVQSAVDLDVHLSHHQFSVSGVGTDPLGDDLAASFAGQRNALCGAAAVTRLTLLTGLHTGSVPVRWEVHDRAPAPLAEVWADVVEVSFLLTRREVGVAGLMSDGVTLEMEPGCYRVRYAAQDFPAGFDLDTPEPGETAPDRYLLQCWPAPPELDTVVRDGSGVAARREPDRSPSVPLPRWQQVLRDEIAAQQADLDDRARSLAAWIQESSPGPAAAPARATGFTTSVVANEVYAATFSRRDG